MTKSPFNMLRAPKLAQKVEGTNEEFPTRAVISTCEFHSVFFGKKPICQNYRSINEFQRRFRSIPQFLCLRE